MSEPALVAPRHMTYEEYVEWSEHQLEKYEFHAGEVLAMSGGSGEHSVINANLTIAIGARLRGRPCTVFDSGIRVRQSRDDDYVYPDVTVVCARPVFEEPLKPSHKRNLTLTNPTLILETLSDSTESYDRGDKFIKYLAVESLREYVLVPQSHHRVESHVRNDDGTWTFDFWQGLDAVAKLRSIGVDLPLAEVYAGTDFDGGGEAVGQSGDAKE